MALSRMGTDIFQQFYDLNDLCRAAIAENDMQEYRRLAVLLDEVLQTIKGTGFADWDSPEDVAYDQLDDNG